MVQLQDRPRIRSQAPVSVGSVITVTGSLSALFAALGAWLYWGPVDGTIDLLFWEWNLADIHVGWGFGLLVTAAALALASVAIAVRRRG